MAKQRHVVTCVACNQAFYSTYTFALHFIEAPLWKRALWRRREQSRRRAAARAAAWEA